MAKKLDILTNKKGWSKSTCQKWHYGQVGQDPKKGLFLLVFYKKIMISSNVQMYGKKILKRFNMPYSLNMTSPSPMEMEDVGVHKV